MRAVGGDGDACGQGACMKRWGEEGKRRDEGERAWREQVGAARCVRGVSRLAEQGACVAQGLRMVAQGLCVAAQV